MKTRIIQTRFWQDDFIASLKPNTKLLFLYLISNANIELTGAYEKPLAYIAIETGLTQAQVKEGFNEIESKIAYLEGYVVIKNHKKYQDYSKGNEHQTLAYEKELASLPVRVRNILLGCPSSEIQLVDNQLASSPQLDRNKKEEIINKKERGEYERGELAEVVNHYNEVFGKKVSSTRGFEKNFTSWREVHSLEKIKQAITKARQDNFWKDKLTLETLFRKKNPQGEDVDWIEKFANSSDETKDEGKAVSNIFSAF